MAGVAEQLLEQVTHLPTGVETPGVYIGAAIAAATFGRAGYGWRRHGRTSEEYAVPMTNPVALDHSIKNVRTGESAGRKHTESRWHRMGGWTLSLVGAGLAAGTLAAGINFESTQQDEQASAVVVLDASSSMLDTGDVDGKTRYRAAVDAIGESDYDGNLAVIVFGADSETVIKLSDDWRSKLPKLDQPKVDSNRGDLSGAVTAAGDLIPRESKGAVLVISDGTVDDTKKELIEVHSALKRDSLPIEVVVPGTPDGSYRLGNTQPVPAGIQPEKLENVAEDNEVEVVATQDDLDKATQNIIESNGKTEQKKPWLVPAFLLGLLGAYGLHKNGKYHERKVI